MDETTCVKLLERHGIKPTSNRIVVVKALAAEEHPSSMTELEEAILTIDKSGISRSHLVHAIEDGNGNVKYELCMSHGSDDDDDDDMHVHFYCEHCHQTFCFYDTPIPHVLLPHGFVMNSINYMVKGLCPSCARKQLK